MTWCSPALYVDGVYIPYALPVDDYVPVTTIKAVEVYRGLTTPVRFRPAGDQCGALVFWTGAEPPRSKKRKTADRARRD
jgi:hypothetical protein